MIFFQREFGKNHGIFELFLSFQNIGNWERDFGNWDFPNHLIWIDKFCDSLNQNIRYLKHEFKQLNFGIEKYKFWQRTSGDACMLYGYSCFSLDSTVNTQFINNQRTQWKSLQCTKKLHDCGREKAKYDMFEKQWWI